MRTGIAATILSMIVFQISAFSEAGRETHVTWTLASCMSCHKQTERAELATRVTRPCRELCASCHKLRDGQHHPVGVQIPGTVRAPLLLTKKGTNTCSTCHDVTKPRTADAAWASQSFIDHVARRSGNKTFFLVMKNNRGQLCRNCH